MKDLKYLAAYLIPFFGIVGLYLQGVWSYGALIFAFGVIPLVEPFFPNSDVNFSREEQESRLKNRFFDWLLYLNLPILYFIVALMIYTLSTATLDVYEYVGIILSTGVVIGACGINVAHELGHRTNARENLIAKGLLLPAFYMHFFIEHNRGHHKHVATDLDPASARYNENIYFFWIRTLLGSYINAWKLESQRLNRQGIPFWSIRNEMLVYQFIQLLYLSLLFYLLNWSGVVAMVLAGLVGALLLETINYIEHYGLRRKKLESGRYERVRPWHSWNSNFELGRIILYELTRHSDHHYIATKKYQTLDHHEEAPQLPLGYPTSMLMALVPPLWFAVMNKRVKKSKTYEVLKTS